MNGQPVVEVERLVKRYGNRRVLDGVDLHVGPGEIVALLGPNGAGKSTTVEIVEGYRRADGGRVRVFGLDPRAGSSSIRPRLGLILQRGELYSQIRVREAVELFASFYPRPLEPRIVLDELGLSPVAEAVYRSLSGGERQRLNLALALVGRPELLILDEPTSAMDPATRHATWGLLRRLSEAGAAVLVTTQRLEEAEHAAHRVAILARGRILATGTPASLAGELSARSGRSAQPLAMLELRDALHDAAEESLARLPSVAKAERTGIATYALTPGAAAERLLAELGDWLDAEGQQVASFHLAPPSLEQVYLELTGDPARVDEPLTDEGRPGAASGPGARAGPGPGGGSGPWPVG